jgi:prepilin-type N-terminal cleavage/methylation domain-containing protein
VKNLNNKRGFTLIEIIVVLIIVGVLASIALPNLFSNVTKSKGAEALAAMSAYKSLTEGCVQSHQPTAGVSCLWTALGFSSASGNFLYTFLTAPSSGSYLYTIQATSKTSASDTVMLFRDTATGQYTCDGNGNFSGIC